MANHYDFEGRVALVTGGASGIGAAVVEPALICWFASEEMTFSTGACFDISGGRATF